MASLWSSWPEVTLLIKGLPASVTTKLIWRTFIAEGLIEYIRINIDSVGDKNGTAVIKFRPPPARAFWEHGTYKYQGAEGISNIRLILDDKLRTYQHPSPSVPGFTFPESTMLSPCHLDFGFMLNPVRMVKMFRAISSSSQKVSLELNLFRRQITVTFDITLKDDRVKGRPVYRKETYRFYIPLDDLREYHEVAISDDARMLVLTLDTPPTFFRKARDVQATLEEKKEFWSERDAWYRQTDIVVDPSVVKALPITLKKTKPIIDIGRWTTYCFKFHRSSTNKDQYNNVLKAFDHYNITKSAVEKFGLTEDVPPAVWEFIDKPTTSDKHVSHTASLMELLEDPPRPPLKFPVRYMLEACISHGFLNEHNLGPDFVEKLSKLKDAAAVDMLEGVMDYKTRIYNPMDIFGRFTGTSLRKNPPHYYSTIRKVTITPTMIYLSSPSLDISNRVLRHFDIQSDRFIRVQFTDEKTEGRLRSQERVGLSEVFTRVMRTMTNGITIGDRHFEFLAFGNSQFRERGAYFYCPDEINSTDNIRKWMGDFSGIQSVSKYAARLGQAFSTTRAMRSPGSLNIIQIDDLVRNNYTFTDGVGKISSFLAQLITNELNLDSIPSVFQFRLGGCKGVLAVDHSLKAHDVCVRKSQYKFASARQTLEIIRWSQFSPAMLNRQIIIVLSSIGVPGRVFEGKLATMLQDIEDSMTHSRKALEMMEKFADPNKMTMKVANMIRNGFMREQEPFFMRSLYLWRSWTVRHLKQHAKIGIECGAFLLGCTDETGTLKGYFEPENRPTSNNKGPFNLEDLSEIFVRVPVGEAYVTITGPCIVARNPSLHPGDIRVVRAVDNPNLQHMKNVVVFPQTGDRDVPGMCSGGDLDGDDYLIIWDNELIPREWDHPSMNYEAPPPQNLGRDVTMTDIIQFFIKYMREDSLGTIANAHLAWADKLEAGVKHHKCMRLAELHSKAVDFVKTGVQAKMPPELRIHQFPHFMEKPAEKSYKSEKLLGRLYDQVKLVDFTPTYHYEFDQRILGAFDCAPEILAKAKELKVTYDSAMRKIMFQQGIETEFEVWTNFVMKHSTLVNDYKYHEEIGRISDVLKETHRDACIEAAGGEGATLIGPFVTAMYTVTEQEVSAAVNSMLLSGKQLQPSDLPLISFPWLFPEILGQIAKQGKSKFDTATMNDSITLDEIFPISSLVNTPATSVSNSDFVVDKKIPEAVTIESILARELTKASGNNDRPLPLSSHALKEVLVEIAPEPVKPIIGDYTELTGGKPESLVDREAQAYLKFEATLIDPTPARPAEKQDPFDFTEIIPDKFTLRGASVLIPENAKPPEILPDDLIDFTEDDASQNTTTPDFWASKLLDIPQLCKSDPPLSASPSAPSPRMIWKPEVPEFRPRFRPDAPAFVPRVLPVVQPLTIPRNMPETPALEFPKGMQEFRTEQPPVEALRAHPKTPESAKFSQNELVLIPLHNYKITQPRANTRTQPVRGQLGAAINAFEWQPYFAPHQAINSNGSAEQTGEEAEEVIEETIGPIGMAAVDLFSKI
ncbi:MAG: hypothetical protein M1829_005540 [Trizodia sp. TS-e1964]|nr:MAG: hypothetical protein M1829_005540 [Trizodia sp. TS-e1964]